MAIRPFPKLDGAIAESGQAAYVVSGGAGVSRLDKIRRGAVEPSAGERSRLANYLGVPEQILFLRREDLVRRDVHVDESELLEHMTTVSPDGSVRP